MLPVWINERTGLYAVRKRRQWFFDIVVQERIGKEEFLKKLFKQGNESSLCRLAGYPELSTPLSRHLLSQLERSDVVQAKQRLSLLRYEQMTTEIFDQFLSLFKQTGSDVTQRALNYPLLLECAIATNQENVRKVLQWIEKRFANEQLMVIEQFLQSLCTYNNQFQLQVVPYNLETIEAILNLAFNHLQKTSTTLKIIVSYAFALLTRAEHHQNKDERDKLQEFSYNIIKR
ncbi:unnamed protein product [Didymodactylos carnosus]|nr:unnamed protein product [Didymodactylos carnosus]CAF4469436.1 unnamed protein product [Didymodactylos carnosus]